jgi:SEC-C motif-containing protein
MRSRYTAYALGLAEYIQKTTHPKSPHFETNKTLWRQGLETFCRTTEFVKLEIKDFGETWVSFAAYLRQGGKNVILEETSQFEKVDTQWLYLNGTVKVISS